MKKDWMAVAPIAAVYFFFLLFAFTADRQEIFIELDINFARLHTGQIDFHLDRITCLGQVHRRGQTGCKPTFPKVAPQT